MEEAPSTEAESAAAGGAPPEEAPASVPLPETPPPEGSAAAELLAQLSANRQAAAAPAGDPRPNGDAQLRAEEAAFSAETAAAAAAKLVAEAEEKAAAEKAAAEKAAAEAEVAAAVEAGAEAARLKVVADENRKKAAEQLKAALQKAAARPVPPRPEVVALRTLCGCVRALSAREGATGALFSEFLQELPRLGEALLGPFMGVRLRKAPTPGTLDAKAGGPLSHTRLKGRVKSYNTKKGFGFLDLEQFPRDIFVYNSQLIGRIGLIAGETVEFELIFDDGRPQAARVKAVPGPATNNGISIQALTGKEGAQQGVEPAAVPTADNPFSALKQAIQQPQQTPQQSPPTMRDLALALAAQASEVPTSLPPAPERKPATPQVAGGVRNAPRNFQPPKTSEDVINDKIREAQRAAAADKAGPTSKLPMSPEAAAEAIYAAQSRAQRQKQDTVGPEFSQQWPTEEDTIQQDASFEDKGPIPVGSTVRVVHFPATEVNNSLGTVNGYDAASGRYRITVDIKKKEGSWEQVPLQLRVEYLQPVEAPSDASRPRGGGMGSVAAASAAAAQAASSLPAQPAPLYPGTSQALVTSAANALKRFGNLVPQSQLQQPPGQQGPPQPPPSFSQPGQMAPQGGKGGPGQPPPWAFGQPAMNAQAFAAQMAALAAANRQASGKPGPPGPESFGKGKGPMGPAPGDFPGQHGPFSQAGPPDGFRAQSPPRPMQQMPPPQPRPDDPNARVVSLAQAVDQQAPGRLSPPVQRPGGGPMGPPPQMMPGGMAPPMGHKGGPPMQGMPPGPGGPRPSPPPQQMPPQQQAPSLQGGMSQATQQRIAKAPQEGFIGQRWRVLESKDFSDVIVREAQEVTSREVRRIRPNEICIQRGPTLALSTGLVRMPVEPDGWVTVHARLIQGPTFLEEYGGEPPMPPQPRPQQQQPQQRQPQVGAQQPWQPQQGPPTGRSEAPQRERPPAVGERSPLRERPDRRQAEGAGRAGDKDRDYAGGDWDNWDGSKEWWNNTKDNSKKTWTQEEWDEWEKGKNWDNWKQWDDWDKDKREDKSKDEKADAARHKASASEESWASAPTKGAGKGKKDGAAKGADPLDPWSKALQGEKESEDPWSKAVDPWSKAVGASSSVRGGPSPPRVRETVKDAVPPSWGSMTKTAGPSYARSDMLAARGVGAMGQEEDCEGWSGVGQLKGIRSMRVPTLEFGAGARSDRRRDRPRGRDRDDVDTKPASRPGATSPPPLRDTTPMRPGARSPVPPPRPQDAGGKPAVEAEPARPAAAAAAAPKPAAAVGQPADTPQPPAAAAKPSGEEKKANCPTQ